jgi:hypothetical protein
MTKQRTYRTPGGRTLIDADIDSIAAHVATAEFDVEQIRRRGRPLLGSGPGEIVPVRLDPVLLGALRARALHDRTTHSDVIRSALRAYLQ